MTARIETIVLEMFDQLEPKATAARSRKRRVDDLVALHEEVGRRFAEHAYMALSSNPEFIDGTLSRDEVGALMEADLDALLSGAAKVRAARNANDVATQLVADARLSNAYFRRHNEICINVILATPQGGRA